MATTTSPAPPRSRGGKPIRTRKVGGPLPVRFYRSAVGKKWVMGVTGVILMGFVLTHLIGNLKLYLSKEELNLYAEALREIPGHLLPRTFLLWVIRLVLIGAFALHIHSAYGLTVINRKARPQGYASKRDYVAARFASRTMRWTGIIVAAFIVFHLADLTWGKTGAEWIRGDAYNNIVYSLQRPVVAIAYSVAMIALGMHLMHGAWSLFQSLGITNPRYNKLRRNFATGFAAVIVIGNLSFPIAVQTGIVGLQCPDAEDIEAPCEV